MLDFHIEEKHMSIPLLLLAPLALAGSLPADGADPSAKPIAYRSPFANFHSHTLDAARDWRQANEALAKEAPAPAHGHGIPMPAMGDKNAPPPAKDAKPPAAHRHHH